MCLDLLINFLLYKFTENLYRRDACGFTIRATDELIVFYSPNYPRHYLPNIDCNWLLMSGQPNRPIKLTINDLKVEQCCDRLEVRKGIYLSNAIIQNAIIGNFDYP